MQEKILIVDFGSQYTQLIARKIRETEVYCEIVPFNKIPPISGQVKGIILSGSPFSVKDASSPRIEIENLQGRAPILGICYGAQLMVQNYGGVVAYSKSREYGRAKLSSFSYKGKLFENVPQNSVVWMSHADSINKLPAGFYSLASTEDIPVAAYGNDQAQLFGLQFHPEVYHTEQGKLILENFVVNICGCEQSWTAASYIEEQVSMIKAQVKNENIIFGLSGGIDSTVASILFHKAIGNQLHCFFIDNGLLRKNEYQQVLDSYKNMGLNIKGINAKSDFISALKGVTDPERKRKIIGSKFIEVFESEGKKLKDIKWLGQGTIYPDVIESVSVKGPSVTIKSHHNVGGLPEKMDLKIIEPLKYLFKDEVRQVGKALGLPGEFLKRHPFPGPGLAIRILGEVNEESIRLAQEADNIFISRLKQLDLYDSIWQAGVILLPVRSVGVMGDERTYENVVALRAVTSTDGMTADWAQLPYEFLVEVSNKIINNIKGINRVVYDISSKPPATIEWE